MDTKPYSNRKSQTKSYRKKFSIDQMTIHLYQQKKKLHQNYTLFKNIKKDFKNLKDNQIKTNKNTKLFQKIISDAEKHIPKIFNIKIKNLNTTQSKQKIDLTGISSSLNVRNFETNKKQNKKQNKKIIPFTSRQISTNQRQPKIQAIMTQKVIISRNRKNFSKMNEQILYEIRQNYLNSQFNKRKQRLMRITKQNRKIYERINSQKSFYSNSDLNKSYQSNAQISRRLSNSKISKSSRISRESNYSNNSSRCSIKFNNKKKIVDVHLQKKKTITLQSKNINQLQTDQIKKFSILFSNNIKKQQLPVQSLLKQKRKKSVGYKQNNQNEIKSERLTVLPKLNQNKTKLLQPLQIKKRDKRYSVLTAINQNIKQTIKSVDVQKNDKNIKNKRLILGQNNNFAILRR